MTNWSEITRMMKLMKRIQKIGVPAASKDPDNEGLHMTPANKRFQVQETTAKGVPAVKEDSNDWDLYSTSTMNCHRVWETAARGVKAAEEDPTDRDL
ncbi:hypothetical protein HOY80DRAFT_1028920 [Tuber brumale]|nr:hypothetical protein HOY80DRAFT_1028920 [Tuber brumale]